MYISCAVHTRDLNLLWSGSTNQTPTHPVHHSSIMASYETPSRIWRRIQDDREPSSLPSLPEFEHSMVPESEPDRTSTDEDNDILPVHSTPAAVSSHTVTSTIRLQSSTSSTARFASSIASRSASAKSSASRTYGRIVQDSFDVSAITSLQHGSEGNTDPEDAPLVKSTNSVPETYLPPLESDDAEDMSLVDALDSVSRASSPFSPELPPEEPTTKKGLKYDYSVSLRAEPQPSPIDKFRNVALRRPVARTRTPSLSHTTSSPSSSPTNSTPRSNRSLPLPGDSESPAPGIHDVFPQGHEYEPESEPERASDADGVPSDREPTFSSASSDPSHPMNRTVQGSRFPIAPSMAASSPATSVAFTPTPAIAPRPRPRFNIAPPAHDLQNASDEQETPGVSMRKAFVGVTPRPGRGRMSHPLAQTYVPDGDYSEAGDDNNASSYDPVGERPSFLSTASSQDLTTHVRANTSYDPALGLGERGKMGRFDAQKLNGYLHGLNRRLQEENVALVARLQKYEEVKEGPRLSIESAGEGRRISAGSALGDVEEESGRESTGIRDLEKERKERDRDKDRWRVRMEGGGKGVSDIVAELERKVEEAEESTRKLSKKSAKSSAKPTKFGSAWKPNADLAFERAAKAESALENGKELGAPCEKPTPKSPPPRLENSEEEVLASDQKIDELQKELKEEKLSNKLAEEDFQSQLSEMGTEVMQATARVQELEEDITERDATLQRLEEELRVKSDELIELQRCMAQDDKETAKEVRALKAHAAELEESTAERVKILEEQLAAAQDRIDEYEAEEEQVNDRIEMLEAETEKATELARQMEEALEAAEEAMERDKETLADLRTKLASLEREQERQRDLSMGDQQSDHEVEEALEAELDDANKEIARLTTLLQQSPARRAIEKARDARIEMLEREKEELTERIRSLKSTNADMATPSRVVNMSGISPIHRHVLSMNLKTPKTPGGPLRDCRSESLSSAGRDCEAANGTLILPTKALIRSLTNFKKLVLVSSTSRSTLKMPAPKSHRLKPRLQGCRRREERRLRRLEKLRCQNERTEADESSLDISHSSLPSNPPTPLTKTSEALRLELQNVNAQLDSMQKQWRDEKRQLLGEKAVLQDAASRMNIEEAEKAKSVIADLEAELQAERTRLRQMSTEQEVFNGRLEALRGSYSALKRQKAKQDNHELEDELRERSLLARDHQDLQRRFAEVSERANKLRNDYSASQKSHENRRQQLDIHLTEIEELRHALSHQTNAFEHTEQEKNRIVMEKTDIARTIAVLEADLKRVRKDAESFGRDLKALRVEKARSEEKQREEAAKAERAKKQAQTQNRLLNEQLESQKEKTKKARQELQHHAKFTRESTLRDDLSYQKQYLLVLLSGFEAGEKRIFACISRIGYPKPPPAVKRPRSLKSAALCIIFIRRAKCASDAWREACSNKQAVAEALQEVRRRRATIESR
ncbi:hypothetical protein BU15DRAFT_61277 [Melanogaster broomeanus]|nr:hypothetical protein BU15DRAFT_61277 [Melanogaster broomeanus]